MKIKVSFFVIVASGFFSCNFDTCSKNLGFELDYHLFDKIYVNGDTYCAIVNKSLSGDAKKISDLSSIVVYDGAVYQHGAVLVEVIDRISEQAYWESIKNTPKKRHICRSIMAGLEYTENPKYSAYSRKSNIESAFPFLSEKLCIR
ncbi:hypothetical protein CH371_15570 [Leptospira wolffii]|uniref:Lipoprotein n=1 Tax=Leptospira wolffii TaxID=409998 RepID=A0A2M9Z906_9LEPT|nr:hypothetical protein [Leptospira wolffii]PJZ64919.1 hypothetical protein CH371_15570 [Leptospira wolffii]